MAPVVTDLYGIDERTARWLVTQIVGSARILPDLPGHSA
jgi:hypothetical protein